VFNVFNEDPISSFKSREVANGQVHRQTDKCHVKHDHLGG